MDHIRGPPPSVLKRQSPAQKAARATTRFLHVSGIDPSAFAALAAEFEQFGPLEDIDGLDLCVEKVSISSVGVNLELDHEIFILCIAFLLGEIQIGIFCGGCNGGALRARMRCCGWTLFAP